MKKMKQQKNKHMYWTTLLIIIVIVSNLALAQSIPTNVQPLSKVFNEANPELFDYINGDYSTVTWSKIPSNLISKIPKDKLKYDELKPEQRIKMTPDQISVNFDKINDLTKEVDADNARLAIKNKFNVNVIQLGSAKIREDILHANDGYKEHITLSNKYYQSGLISIFAQTGEIIFTPLEEEINVPEQDAVTIDVSGQKHKYKGYVIKEGILSFKEGKTFIKPNGNSVIINDVLINPTKSHAIDVYIEPLTNHDGNYVAFFKEGLDIGTTKEGAIIVMPKPGNLLFNMVKREYKKDKEGKLIRDEFILVEDNRDKLFIIVKKGDNLKVVSREKEGKTPLIRHFDGGGETNIQTGRNMRFTFINGKLSYRPPKPVSEEEIGRIDTTSSVAFELVSDTDFNTVVRTSSSNRFIQMYKGKQNAGNNMGLEVSDLIKPNMVKTIDDLSVNYQNILFTIDNRGGFSTSDYNEVTTNLIQVINEWLRGKEGVEKYFENKINLVSIYNAGFFGIPTDIKLVVGERVVDPMYLQKNPIRDIETPLQVFDHELAHAIDYVIKEKENKLLNEFIKKIKDSPEFMEEVNTVIKEDYQMSPENADDYIKSSAEQMVFKNHIAKELNLQKEQENMLFTYELNYYDKYPTIIESLKRMESSKEFAEFVRGYNELKKSYGLNDIQTVGVIKVIEDSKQLNVDKNTKKEFNNYLKRKLDSIFKQNIGLYRYSLMENIIAGGNELFSTFGELPPETARKHMELAQVEFDRVMSTDPPIWLKKRAEERYYAIMGGQEGVYCKANPCGPCLRYKVTCETESIS